MATFLRTYTAFLATGSLLLYPVNLPSQQNAPPSRDGGQWVGDAIQAIDTTVGPLMGQPGNLPSSGTRVNHLTAPPQIPGQITPEAQEILARMVSQEALIGPFRGCAIPQNLPALDNHQCQEDLPVPLPPPAPGQPHPFAIYQQRLINANKNTVFFEGMLDISPSTTPNGLKCLEGRMELEKAKFQSILNFLSAQKDEIKKRNELFKAQAKRLREKMEDLNAVLSGEANFGGSNASRPAGRLKGLINSDSCQDILTVGRIEEAQGRGGLRGLRSQIHESNAKARQYRQNEDQLIDDIEARLNNIAGGIRNYGVDAWIDNANAPILGEVTIGNFNALKSEEIQKFKMDRDRIRGELQNLGHMGELPRAVKTFRSRFDAQEAGKKYIDSCVMGNDRSIMGLGNLQSVIGGLIQEGASREGATGTLESFRSEVTSILNREGFIEDKMLDIGKVVEHYGVNTITTEYRVDGKNVQSNIHVVLSRAIENCQEEYNLEDGQGLSAKKRHEEISDFFEEYDGAVDKFAETITGSLRRQILECNGETLPAGSCQDDVYSTDSPSFCFKKAEQCAKDMSGCYSLLEKGIEKKEMELNLIADDYNEGIKNLIDAQNAVLNTLKTRIYSYGHLVAGTTGTPFALPEDVFISMPELSRSSLGGVLLSGGDNVEAIFEKVTAKIDLLQQALGDQNKAMMAKLNEKFNEHRNNMRENKERWQNVADTCRQKIKQFNTAMGQLQGQQMAQQQELMGKADQFCRKFDSWKGRNPLAGCDDADSLYEDALEVASVLTPEAAEYIDDYKYACAEMNNEAEKGTEGEISEAGFILDDCLRNPKVASESLRERAVETALASLDTEEDRTKMADYLKGEGEGEPSFLRELRRSDPRAHRQLTRLRDALNKKPADTQDADSTMKRIFTTSDSGLDKINGVLHRLKGEKCTPAGPETTSLCEWMNSDSSGQGSNVITQENIDEHRNEIESLVLPLTTPLERDSIVDLLNEDKRLKEMTRRQLDKVFNDQDKNFCTLLAAEAISDVAQSCKGEDNPRDCFEEELEELQTEGTAASRFLASVVEDSPDKKFDDNIGELHGIDISCTNMDDGQRDESPVDGPGEENHGQTLNEQIYGQER